MLPERRLRDDEIPGKTRHLLRREDKWLPSETDKSDPRKNYKSTEATSYAEVPIQFVDHTPYWRRNLLVLVVLVSVIVVVIIVIVAVTV